MNKLKLNLKNVEHYLKTKNFYLECTSFADPSTNRKTIKAFCDKRPGAYVWEAPNNKVYVGRSTNLYTRIRSYFLPSVLKRRDQRVISYFNKHRFKHTLLHVLALHQPVNIEIIINLEQALLEHLKPSLNIETFARCTRYAQPFGHSEVSKRKRSKPVYV